MEWLLNLLFPRLCVSCGKEGAWACPACQSLASPRRQIHTLEGLDGVVSLFTFDTFLIRELIHHLKYYSIQEAASTLIKLISERFSPEEILGFLGRNSVLVPVPTSKAKLKTRGYNQAEILAKQLANWLELPVWVGGLKRGGGVKSQVQHTALQRKENVSQVFYVEKGGVPAQFRARNLVLIDDVYTTGATLSACARALLPHTKNSIKALVIAHEQ